MTKATELKEEYYCAADRLVEVLDLMAKEQAAHGDVYNVYEIVKVGRSINGLTRRLQLIGVLKND